MFDLSKVVWKKSTRSGAAGHCVETAFLEFGPVAVRDSKDKAGPALVFTPGAWDSFIDGVKAGDFARP